MKFHKSRSARAAIPVAVVTLAMALTGCGSSSSGSAAGSGEYVIGASLPLTGPTTVYGSNLGGGLQAYFDYVNSSGGVNGKKIKIVQADGGFDTATTVQSLKTLAQSKPIAIGGLLVTQATKGAISTIDGLKIASFASSPESSFNRPPASKYLFGAGGPMIDDEAFLMADFAKAKLFASGEKPNVFMVNFISSTSSLWATNMQTIAKDGGWNVLGNETYQTGTNNFDALAAKIVAAKPKYLFMALDTTGFTLLKALKAAGLTATIITTQGGPHADQLESLNYPSIYVDREIVYPTGTDKAVTDYLARVKAVGGSVDPTSHVTQYGYLQAEVIVSVLQKCGAQCDSSSFLTTMSALTTVDTGGFTFGPITYSAQDNAGLHTGAFYTWDASAKQVKLMPGTYSYPK